MTVFKGKLVGPPARTFEEDLAEKIRDDNLSVDGPFRPTARDLYPDQSDPGMYPSPIVSKRVDLEPRAEEPEGFGPPRYKPFDDKPFDERTDDPTLSNEYIDGAEQRNNVLRKAKARAQGRSPSAAAAPKAEAPTSAAAPPPRRPLTPNEDFADDSPGMPAARPSKAPDDELRAAQQQASTNTNRSKLAQAGRIIGRAGLAKPAHWKEMDARNFADDQRPLTDLLQRRQEDSRQANERRLDEDQSFQRTAEGRAGETHGVQMERAGRERDFNDPSSQLSKTRRAQLLTMYPKFAGRLSSQDFASLSAADVDVYLKELAQERNANALRASRGMQIDAAKYGAAQQTLDVLRKNIGVMQNAIDNPRQGLFGPDTAYAGRWDSRKPAELSDSDDIQVGQAARGAAASYINMISGKTATEQERQFLMQAYGINPGASEQQFIHGVKKLGEDVELMARGEAAKFHPEVVQFFQSRMQQDGDGNVTQIDERVRMPMPQQGGGWSDADERRLQELEARARGGR